MTADNHKGILVVSFGTLHQETCTKTIGAIEDDLAKAFPERRFYSAWTSEFIIKKLKEKHGVHRDSVSEALVRMKDDGITDLLVQPTHLLDAFENKRLEGLLKDNAGLFDTVSMGRPALNSQEDAQRLAEVIAAEIYSTNVSDSKTALVLMGHGSANDPQANAVYARLQECLTAMGLGEIVVGTVEGSPSLDDALALLAENCGGINKAVITPLMVVAGNHAVKDMNGNQEDSWKNILRSKGFEVTTLIKGLGEYTGFRNMLIVHAVSAERLK